MRNPALRVQKREETEIYCPCRAIIRLRHRLFGRKGILFTDETVLSLYSEKLRSLGFPVFAMKAGEEYKTKETLFSLLQAMAEGEMGRDGVLVAVGGGTVTDVGGLAAALYMRGVECIYVPTTVLCAVDAAIGGKTAVDFCGVKNLVGAFRQPEAVYIDPSFFLTLPPRELTSGAGEIVKHAALSGELFDLIRGQEEKLKTPAFLASVLPQNIAVKASFVKRDPFETEGLRAALNLGHTTGHALELGEGLSHGEGVLVGIAYEAELARRFLKTDEAYLDELLEMVKKVLGGPVGEYDPSLYVPRTRLDKKNRGGQIVLTVPTGKGETAPLALSQETYRSALRDIREGFAEKEGTC